MTRNFSIVFSAAVLMATSQVSFAQTPHLKPEIEAQGFVTEAEASLPKDGFTRWMEKEVLPQAEEKFSPATVSMLRQLKFDPQVIKLDRKQPESSKSFSEYIRGVVSTKRIQKGRQLTNKHKTLFHKIEETYGVPKEVVAALWGIETSYGKITGNYRIVNSLATLAYEGRRRDLFKEELFAALHILDEKKLHTDDLRGSWAGAMGQTQFMPSSYRKYAVDQNGDGKVDIWHTQEDVLASIANYMKTLGWDKSKPWGVQVKLPKNFDAKLISTTVTTDDGKIMKPVSFWKEQGIKSASTKHSLPADFVQAQLIQPGGPAGHTYLVTDNYRAIMGWNRSLYFATAVGKLSDAIKQ